MLRKIIITLFVIVLLPALAVLIPNAAVVIKATPQILPAEEAVAAFDGDADCILVLGASVKNGEPSPILANRLDKALEVFGDGGSKLILLSGDGSGVNYNEPVAMMKYALAQGADEGLSDANIYLDYAGFSTYDSMKRAKEIFGAKKVIVVTQRYHLYRALYIGEQVGLEVVGVAAEDRPTNQRQRDLREVPARVKDFVLCLIEAEPSVAGYPIPLEYPSIQEKG